MTFEQELQTQFQQALQTLAQGNWPLAETQLREITERWPTCIEAWFQRGELCQRQGQLVAALDMYARVLELNPNVQEVYFSLGQIASQQQEHSQALGYWQRALEINPDYHEVRLHLILLLARLGQPPEALAQALELLGRVPASAPLLLDQARDLLARGQLLETSAICQALRQTSYEVGHVLLLELRLLHELGLDAQAEVLLSETPTGDAADKAWRAALRELYVPAHYADDQALDAAREKLDRFLAQAPDAALKTLPAAQLRDLPRLRGWHLLERAAAVDTWLQAALPPAETSLVSLSQPGERRRLVWLLDAASLPWQSLYWQHLAALSRREWDIVVLLQQDSLRLLIEQATVPALTGISTLPGELDAARSTLANLAPQVLLYSNPEGDGLQFWLSRQHLAPLQLAWPAHGTHTNFTPASRRLDAVAPLLPVPGTPRSSQRGPDAPQLYLLPAQGWSPAELAALSKLEGPVLVGCPPDGLGAQHQLLSRLPENVRGVVWRSQNELQALLERVSALLLPCIGDPAATALAVATDLPLHTLVDGAWQPAEAPAPTDPLPHTSWAVEVRHRLTQSLKEYL